MSGKTSAFEVNQFAANSGRIAAKTPMAPGDGPSRGGGASRRRASFEQWRIEDALGNKPAGPIDPPQLAVLVTRTARRIGRHALGWTSRGRGFRQPRRCRRCWRCRRRGHRPSCAARRFQCQRRCPGRCSFRRGCRPAAPSALLHSPRFMRKRTSAFDSAWVNPAFPGRPSGPSAPSISIASGLPNDQNMSSNS